MNRWVLHLLFWSFSFYILLHLFSGSSQIERIDWIYTGIFIVTIISAALINLYLLIPFLLQKGRYLFFLVCLIVLLLIASLVNHLLFDRWIDTILPGYYFISYYDYWDISKFFIAFIAVTSLLKLSKDWFYLNKAQQRLQELEKAKVEAELSALKNQVNPHFLFNSLNVLYSLVRKKAKEAPEAIIKLSDILRYVLYEANEEFVPLQKEIKLIRDYMDLQQYRHETKVHFQRNVDDEETPILSMIMLPLIENAYKHGDKSTKNELEIQINLNCSGNKFEFSVENPVSDKARESMEHHSGIGLENIRKRLEYFYPDHFQLEIRNERNRHLVTLMITIK